MTRSLSEIDADLARWIDTAARTGKAIDDLTQDPVFLRLKAQSRLGNLTGVSQTRGGAVVATAEQLWTFFLSLDKALTEAAELRRSKNPFGAEERLDKIDALLTGPAITLPAGQTALSQMTLSGPQERRVCLAEIFAAMDAAFIAARDTVLAAARGWDQTGVLDGFRNTATRLEGEAAALGYAPPAALAEARRAIAAASTAVETDPIGADDAGTRISTLLAQADQALTAARNDCATARTVLQEAEQRLAGLRDLAEQGLRLRDDRLAQVAEPLPDRPPPDPVPELRQWLDTLNKTAREGRPRAASIGAASWNARADQAEAELRASLDCDQQVLDARGQLRGRLSALTAKAEARAARAPLSQDLREAFDRAKTLLFGQATPLPEAVQLLRRCEKL